MERDNFSDIYVKYRKVIGSFISQRVSNYHDVEDLISTVFLKVFIYYSEKQLTEKAMFSLLHTVANNAVKDYYKRKHIMTEVDIEDLPDIPDEMTSHFTDIADNITTYMYIKEAMKQLSKDRREVIFLKYYKDMELSEISAYTGRKKENIKHSTRCGLRQIRMYIEARGGT